MKGAMFWRTGYLAGIPLLERNFPDTSILVGVEGRVNSTEIEAFVSGAGVRGAGDDGLELARLECVTYCCRRYHRAYQLYKRGWRRANAIRSAGLWFCVVSGAHGSCDRPSESGCDQRC